MVEVWGVTVSAVQLAEKVLSEGSRLSMTFNTPLQTQSGESAESHMHHVLDQIRSDWDRCEAGSSCLQVGLDL